MATSKRYKDSRESPALTLLLAKRLGLQNSMLPMLTHGLNFQLASMSRKFKVTPNPALDLAPFGRWTLRDKAAQCRPALRYGPLLEPFCYD